MLIQSNQTKHLSRIVEKHTVIVRVSDISFGYFVHIEVFPEAGDSFVLAESVVDGNLLSPLHVAQIVISEITRTHPLNIREEARLFAVMYGEPLTQAFT